MWGAIATRHGVEPARTRNERAAAAPEPRGTPAGSVSRRLGDADTKSSRAARGRHAWGCGIRQPGVLLRRPIGRGVMIGWDGMGWLDHFTYCTRGRLAPLELVASDGPGVSCRRRRRRRARGSVYSHRACVPGWVGNARAGPPPVVLWHGVSFVADLFLSAAGASTSVSTDVDL